MVAPMSKHISSEAVRDEKAWEIEVTGAISAQGLSEHRLHVLQDLKKSVELKGFRPGKAPESEILKAVGEAEVLRRTIEHSIRHELPEILARENAPVIETPRVSVTGAPKSFEDDTPVTFTARAGLAPEIKLPDFKKTAKKHNETAITVEVSDEEHAQTLTHLKRERARITKVELGLSPKEAAEQAQAMEEKDLPDLDEEFVKSLGYESFEKFKDAVRANIKTEKEMREIEKRRAALLDELVENSAIKYPQILKEYELDEMEERMKQDIEQMGFTYEKYLEQAKKSREDIRKEWDQAADKRAKVRLMLSEIARQENIDADREKVEREVKHAKEHYPNADESGLRAHITHALRNEAVIGYLERQ